MNGLLLDDGAWRRALDGDPEGRAIYRRHYSARQYRDGRRPQLFVGPGEKLVLVAHGGRALFIWRKFTDDSGQKGVNCAAFRNEGAGLSSALITEADAIAWARWPGERLYTYVDGGAIRSTNPGYCFLAAGWRHVGWTKGGHGRRSLRILEARPELFAQAAAALLSAGHAEVPAAGSGRESKECSSLAMVSPGALTALQDHAKGPTASKSSIARREHEVVDHRVTSAGQHVTAGVGNATAFGRAIGSLSGG